MDNRTIDVVSMGDTNLALALELIWPNARGGRATHYKVLRLTEKTTYFSKEKISGHVTSFIEDTNGVTTLVLLWGEERGASELPFPLDLENVVPFVRGWLMNGADYHIYPDTHINSKRGWRIFTEDWGYVANHTRAIVGVQPMWAIPRK